VGIVDEDIVRVREATDIVAVVSQHLQLKRVGNRWVGLCPFHAEKSPSFSVNAEQGLYYCFGCQAKGDAITFVREIEHLDFPGSVEWLAAKAGITLRYTDTGENEGRKRRKRLVETMEKAVAWYHERLLSGADAKEARGYLRTRGFDGDKVRQYQLGWAPDDWDALARYLKVPDDVLQDAGLGFVNKRNRQQDAFRGRVLFPIFDVQGEPVAFGGRILPGHDGPKYKNSSESKLYAKSKVLYGLNWMKAGIVEADEAIVCEGYTDVIGFAEAGIPRAVATCGTALTEEHFRTLKRYARRVVLAFDADAAGQAAAERFYEWEKAYEIDVAVADLPPGVDPADLARTDPSALVSAVENATPFLGFRVRRALAAGSVSSPEGRARTAEAALTVIAEHPSGLVRDQYVMEVADRCRLDPDQLRAQLGRVGRGDDRPVAVARPQRQNESAEIEALRLAVHHPESVGHLLDEVLFEDELHAAVFRALAPGGTMHDVLERCDPGAADLLQRLVVEEAEADPDNVASLLTAAAARRELRRLDARNRRSHDLEVAKQIAWLKMAIERVDPDEADPEARAQLLAWLVDEAAVAEEN
jgi:DNA primase